MLAFSRSHNTLESNNSGFVFWLCWSINICFPTHSLLQSVCDPLSTHTKSKNRARFVVRSLCKPFTSTCCVDPTNATIVAHSNRTLRIRRGPCLQPCVPCSSSIYPPTKSSQTPSSTLLRSIRPTTKNLQKLQQIPKPSTRLLQTQQR